MRDMLLDKSADGIDNFIRMVYAIPLLSQDEEAKLANNLQQFNCIESAQKLIMSNMRVVIHTAKGLVGYGLPIADLIQEGTIGLMKAVKAFNLKFECRLSTYSVPWIKSEMLNYIINNWTIVKLGTTKAKRKLFFNLRSLIDKTNKQIASELNIDEDEVDDMRIAMHGGFNVQFFSDEEDNENGYAPESYIQDMSMEPSRLLENKQNDKHAALSKAINQLDERQQLIIRERFLSDNSKTLHELGAELGVSYERVRQLEVKAISQLKQLMT